MTERELSIKLREDARRMNLCDKWYNEWDDDTSMQELIEKYIRGNDFCFQHRWPSNSFIKAHFPQEILRKNGILVDDVRSFPVRDEDTRRQIYLKDFILLGKSEATIRYSFSKNMCNVWVRDNSKVRVFAKYGAFVVVHLFDNSHADVTTDSVTNATVIRHSRNATVSKDGNVKVKDEFDYLD